MVTATLTTKGQITIPKAVRDRLHLRCGDRIEFVLHGEAEAVFRPLTRSVEEVFGRLRDPRGRRCTVAQMKAAVTRRLARGDA